MHNKHNNIFKYFSSPTAKPYQFPDASELRAPKEFLFEDLSDEAEPEVQAESVAPIPEEPTNPVSFAQYQADSILRNARQEAEEILAQAREEARQQAEEIRRQAQQEGFEQGRAEGVAQGMELAMEECLNNQEEKLLELEGEVREFLEAASARVDRLLDQHVEELRDLAIAIAEKVVCVSLKSSDSVITRMIQAAIDKRKRREWVQIYIAECDAKRLTPIPASLTAALDMLSDRVRIIPIADEEAGTCIIEMPGEIIDASASTQIKNIRAIVNKAPLPSAGQKDG